ncbi:MAG: 50S ribosomal protein L10 [Candidatus Omnitrophica bacterium]|nr:50S ribosomal protein L10 [Candidatus Omnitrophota bacterium]
MAKLEKQCMVKEVADAFKKSSGVIVTNFEKLSVIDIDELRRKLEKRSSRLVVTKNTLVKRALSEAQYGDAAQFIQGSTGVAVYDDDPVAVAKTLYEFSKSHETFKVRGGIVDGALVNEAGTKQLSELPSKDVLRAMVLMRMKSPISGLVNVLSGPVRGLVIALNEIGKRKNG